MITTKTFFETLDKSRPSWSSQLDWDINGQFIQIPPSDLKDLNPLFEAVEHGFKIDKEKESEYFSQQRNIYKGFSNGHFPLESSLRIWNLLKDAGCSNIFEVFGGTKEIEKIESRSPQTFYENLCATLPTEIFQAEISQAQPNYFKESVRGVMYRVFDNIEIDGKHPIDWLAGLGIKSIPYEIFWDHWGMNKCIVGGEKKQEKTLKELRVALDRNQITFDKNLVDKGSQFLIIILSKLSPKVYPLLASFGLSFESLAQELDLPHPFFALATLGHKNLATRFMALKAELAVKNPNIDWVDLLNQKDKTGVPICHYLARNRDLDSLKLFQSWGADLKGTDSKGNTVLHWLMRKYSAPNQKTFVPILSWLINQGVDWEAANKKGQLPAHKLAQSGTLESLVGAMNLCGVSGLRKMDKKGKTGLDTLQNREDKDSILPVTEKLLLDESLRAVPHKTSKSRL